MSNLKDSIISSYTETMDDYFESPEYREPLWEFNKMFNKVSKLLDPDDRQALSDLFNAYDEICEDAKSEAFYRGVMLGIAERDSFEGK